MRFSCDFVNMSVKQHMLRQRSPFDASAMKFRLFFVGFCPFSPFFFGFPTTANQRVPKKFHHSETSSCVSRAIAKRSSWMEPGRERNGNVMWQSHITAVAVSHCSCFFPALFSELLNTMVFNPSHHLTIRT